MELKEYNKKAYNNLIKMYNRGIKRVAIIHPTGTGKSYIVGQLVEENPSNKIFIVAPNNVILDRYRKMFEKNDIDTSNVILISYNKLLYMKNEQLENLKLDNIILDEFHHCGAKEWSKGVKKLIEASKSAKVLGLSATPIRYLDKLRNMAEELFEGNIASEITLPEAILDGLLQEMQYHQGLVSTRQETEILNKLIEGLTENEAKKLLKKEFEKVKDIASNVASINQILKDGIPKDRRDGKYIVFCKNIKDMHKAMKLANKWFDRINHVEIYSVASKDINGKIIPRNQNKKEIELFENSKSDKIKLIFSIDMLNEGIHVENVDGVIMLRSTRSPNLYKQLLGRALSIGQTKKALIFDFAYNISCTEHIYQIKKEMKSVIEKRKSQGKDVAKEQKILEGFTIFDYIVEIKDLIKALDDRTFRSVALERILKVQEWMKECNNNKRPTKDSKDNYEKKLARWYDRIKRRIVKPYKNLTTEVEKKAYREKYPDIEKMIQIMEKIEKPVHLRNIINIKSWIESVGINKGPSTTAKDKYERTLGKQLANAKYVLINPYLKLQTERERVEFRKEHPEIDEVMKIIKEIDEMIMPVHLRNVIKAEKWAMNKTRLPSAASKNLEERKAGKDLSSTRQNLIRPYLLLQTEEEKIEFRKKHPETDEVLEKITHLDLNYGTKRNRELALLIRQDLMVRSTLKEVKKLEKGYKEELDRRKRLEK